MERTINIGDMVIHKSHGAIGKVVEFNTFNSVEYAFVKTQRGVIFHEPVYEWKKI